MASGGLYTSVDRQIITEVMETEGLHPDDIPSEHGVNPASLQQIKGSRRYYRCKAFASFDEHVDTDPDTCYHSWKSAHAWCVLDLKKQHIAHRWCQECKHCDKKCIPEFDRSAIRRMAEFAVDLCLKQLGRREFEERSFDLGDMERVLAGPHDEERCEMCQALGHSCWQ